MEIGSVLDLRDSVGSTLAALYSRREDRDCVDVAAIVLSGRWTPDEVIGLGTHNDRGLEPEMLARVLHDDAIPTSPRFEDYRIGRGDRSSYAGSLGTTARRCA